MFVSAKVRVPYRHPCPEDLLEYFLDSVVVELSLICELPNVVNVTFVSKGMGMRAAEVVPQSIS